MQSANHRNSGKGYDDVKIISRGTFVGLLLAGLCAASLQTIGANRAVAEDLKKVTVALDWTPNTNHIGLYVAREKGFFRAAGLDVQILPYTDTAAGTLVSNGRADFGIVGTGLFSQKAAGADLRAVFAIVQYDTGRLIVEAKRANITRPRDLDGLIYGGFGSAWERALISSMIKFDGGTGNIKTVTLGTSAYEALRNGSVDFTLEVSTWEGVQADLAGEKLKEFKYSDYGVPEQHTTMIASSDAFLAAHADIASAFLAAVRQGYAYAVDHPDEAADILIAANSAALTDRALVQESMKKLVEGHYLRTADGVVGTLDPAKIEGIGNYMFKSGILVDQNGAVLTKAPDFSAYFSNAYLPKN